jgi:hypothetical protein
LQNEKDCAIKLFEAKMSYFKTFDGLLAQKAKAFIKVLKGSYYEIQNNQKSFA